jgi:hypothetical protein
MLLAEEVLHAYAIISNSIMLLFTSLFKNRKILDWKSKQKQEIWKNRKHNEVFENVLNTTETIPEDVCDCCILPASAWLV